MNIQILKQPDVLKQFAFSKSTLFTQINQGLMPKPISLGSRSRGYLQHELDAVMRARVQGKPDSQIKELVQELLAKRNGDFQ